MLLDRRAFLAALVAATTARGRALAQSRVPRVGVVSGGTASLNSFLSGLRGLGYVPGRTIVVEHRQTQGRAERYAPAVDSLLKAEVDVLVVASSHGATAARTRGGALPIIVLDLETDPVAAGFVATLARPGGNVTGFFLDVPEMSGKQVQLLKEAVPGITRVCVLWEAAIARAQFDATEQAARAASITIHPAPVRSPDDFEAALDGAARSGAGALIALSAPLMRLHQARIDELALRHRLPGITLFPLLANGSGFMSYGPNLDDMYRRSAAYVDRILKGARAGDLPVERPSTFELAINLRTARRLGLTLPPSLVLRADRVIE